MKKPEGSYRQILKSTSIIGGSSVINIFLRIIRMKFLAVFLGPAGVGLLGIYTSITEMVGTVSGMGIDSSGVRQIAQAAGQGDEDRIARIVYTLRRIFFCFGLLGMITLIAFSGPVSRLTFENSSYAPTIALLSVIILFEAMINGEIALIQGLRRIGDLAKMSIFGSLFGTIFSIPIIYIWGRNGLVPFLLAASIMSAATTWYYSKKIRVSQVTLKWVDMRAELVPLLKLGFVIMASALMDKGTIYMSRLIIARHLSLDAVGLYQAAITLSSIYAGFILNSMVKDYIPRLTAVSDDNAECNTLINQQVEVGVLLSVPGILGTLTFAPLIIELFYSAKFVGAFEILRWQTLGVLLRVVSWPMGLLLQAKGLGKRILVTEVLTNIVHVCLIWTGISYFGLKGTGIAFFGMYIFYGVVVFVIAKRLTGFAWSGANMKNALLIVPALVAVFLCRFILPDLWSLILGSLITTGMAFYSFKSLFEILNPDGFAPYLEKMKHKLLRSTY